MAPCGDHAAESYEFVGTAESGALAGADWIQPWSPLLVGERLVHDGGVV